MDLEKLRTKKWKLFLYSLGILSHCILHTILLILKQLNLIFHIHGYLRSSEFSIFSQLSLIFTKKNMKNKDHLGTNGTQNLPKRIATTKKITVVLIR